MAESSKEELSACCKATIIADYMGDPSVPGGTMSWAACSKCGQPIRDDDQYQRILKATHAICMVAYQLSVSVHASDGRHRKEFRETLDRIANELERAIERIAPVS